ncbi:MAG: serine/threonine protein kinase [Lentisphaeraceae bacterium]|nr:serine/threonine protein kinase [Lentisphaeraceae bacterium]
MKIICPECSHTTEGENINVGDTIACQSCSHSYKFNVESIVADIDLEKIKAAIGPTESNSPDDDPDGEIPTDVPEILGNYKIEREIGVGAVGKVYLAKHKSLNIPVAIKILSRSISENLVTSQRFIREAQSAAQMNHVNIVRVLDCGIQTELIYYVMEYVKGGSTGDQIKQGRKFSEDEVLSIGQSVCRALHEAEKISIVHRDIKPDNIMIAMEGVYKLADLGLAKSPESKEQNTRADLTGYQIGMGTPHYMAPEQALDAKNVDIRADLYSLGVTLFQLATGALPYPGNDVGAVLRKHAMKEIPDPGEINRDLSPGFCKMTMKCMSKMPEDRYSSPKELELLLNELRKPLMEGKPIHQDTVSDMSANISSALSKSGRGGFSSKISNSKPYKTTIICLILLVIILALLVNYL